MTQVDQAVQAINLGILEGRYAPGQRLIETELTREIGVSRNTLRAALRRLAADGLVQIEDFRGAMVARPSRKEMRDLFEVREALEGLAARRSATNIIRPGLRQRAEAVGRPLLVSRKLTPKPEEHLWENRQFHDLILELADNTHLGRVLDQLLMPVFQRAFFRVYDASLYRKSVSDHRLILNAVLAGDGPAAEDAMRAHVRWTATLAENIPDSLFRPD
ncbi:MAG: GntR family transcriptional regulator [Bradyrhizobium sp.]|uniref:GntR family transcriptional regulator n=1 Tax=Bradyrhizobium sp. TaxID=376 RepID=UPI0025C2C3A1|nr:GntR family transcriptional regulator [Bradyrhizobium sp.]MBI5263423.1 GntR family transcriptional regulator [Bradyrhizobium sp.]